LFAYQIDDLAYRYADKSNLLLKVPDAANAYIGFIDDGDGTINGMDDYDYDANGNLVSYQNKRIDRIRYNHLNLPTRIQFSNGGTIFYFYNAAGVKLKKEVHAVLPTNEITTTDYLGGFQYENTVLQFFPHPEGYVKNTLNKIGKPTYDYIYNYTDHLGNIRLSYTLDPQTNVLKILEENHYYPFGLKHTNYSSSRRSFKPETDVNPKFIAPVVEDSYKYKYNGKEWQDELGLNLYDYEARLYDPAIGRMLQIDPNAYKYGKHTPYNYAFNNPVLVTDPDGKDGIVSGSGTRDDPYRVRANYYYYGLDNDQRDGFVSAINSFNNGGNAYEMKDADGNKIYTVFELNAIEANDEASANELARNDVINIENENGQIASLGFGNTVTNGPAGDSKHLGNADSRHINLDGSSTKNFFNSPNPNTSISSIYKGVSIHEIGHNLGGNHNDPGNIMSHSSKTYNSGSGINQTERTVYSSPAVNIQGVQAIMGRMVNSNQVLNNQYAGYGTTQTRYFGPRQNARITEGSVGRLVYNPD